jgi:hypothetical protein
MSGPVARVGSSIQNYLHTKYTYVQRRMYICMHSTYFYREMISFSTKYPATRSAHTRHNAGWKKYIKKRRKGEEKKEFQKDLFTK